MIKDVSKVIVVDLELTCWEGEPPQGESAEIIQIGWALLPMDTCIPLEKGAILVRPTTSKISEYCTALTGITPKMANSGLPFDHGCKYIMKKVGGRSKPWAAWGSDREALAEQCSRTAAEFPFSESHLDVQLLATLFLDYGKPRMALEVAMEMLQIAPCGMKHRADNDAFDTAMVLGKVLASKRDKK